MKYFKTLVLIVCVIGLAVTSYAERKLVVVGESFPPFEFMKDGKAVGVDVDIATTIFKEMNIDVEVKILPWKRAWKMIETGKADAVFSTSRKDKRKPFLYYPEENMWVSEYVFFKQGEVGETMSIGYQDALKNKYTVGVIRGNSYHDSFWNAFPNQPDGSLNAMLEEAVDADINFQKLAKGRMDLFIIDKIVGLYLVRINDLQDKIIYSNQVLFSKGYPMPFAKKSNYPEIDKIAQQFEQKLIEIKKNGEYQKILDRWLK